VQRFHFSAENLLSVRKHEEEGTLQRFSDAAEVAREHHERLQATDDAIMRTVMAPVSVDPMVADLYLQRMSRQRAEQQWMATESAGQVERARVLVAQAQAKRQAVERLRERQFDEWNRQALREEDRDLSEQAIGRTLRHAQEQTA
jgi:flagellar export protein FliJ